MDDKIDDFLEHYGVKGMKWGVRHDRMRFGSSGSSSGSTALSAKGAAAAFDTKIIKSLNDGISKLTDRDKAVLKAAGASPLQAEAMRAKYGPDSNKPDTQKNGLSPAQKKLIIYGAIGLGVAGLVAYSIHADKQDTLNSLMGGGFEKEAAKAFLKEKPDDAKVLGGLLSGGMKRPAAEYLMASDAQKVHNALGLTEEALSKFSHEDLSFEPGHLFKRVSTVAEDSIRPDGFFASHSDVDTNRYKAVLPTYWKMWFPLNPPKSGFVNHLASDQMVKVASEGTMYDIIKGQLDTPMGVGGLMRSQTLRDHLTLGTGKTYSSDDELVRAHYYSMIASFADPNSAVAKKLGNAFKAAGYHGIIDSNDAGSLSGQPIRFLDGSIFKIVGHEVLSAQGISDAQDKILALQHYMAFLLSCAEEGLISSDDTIDNFLEHYGVKGMCCDVHQQTLRDVNEFTNPKRCPETKEHDMNQPIDVDEFLEHHGVKGMHWGVHRNRSGGSSPDGGSKPSAQEIHSARAAQAARKAAYKQAKASGDTAAAAKAAKEFNTSKDRAVAAHLTRGEKAVTFALSGALGASSLGTLQANRAANLKGKSVVGHLLLDNSLGVFAIARAGHQAKKLSSTS